MRKFQKLLCILLVVLLIQGCGTSANAVTMETAETQQSTLIETVPQETVLVEEDVQVFASEDPEEVPGVEVISEVSVKEAPEEILPERATYNTVPLYFQTDYPNTMYAGGTIAKNGCSIVSLAMVATYLTGHEYRPDELARYFGGKGVNNIARLEYGSQAMQLPYERPENWHKTLAALQEGKIAIALMGPRSIFTDSQHFIVLTGMTEDGKILVNDPNAANYDRWDLKNAFQVGFEPGDICCGFSGAWVYDKNAMPEEPFLYHEEDVILSDPRYPEIELTAEEKQLLARVVWVEAQGECAEGQQAVAEVVLNRMHSDRFGDTLKGVIYAQGQFRSVPFLDDATPYQAQYEAIEKAIYGPYVLPENVFYFATYPATEEIWGEIGGHIFCY